MSTSVYTMESEALTQSAFWLSVLKGQGGGMWQQKCVSRSLKHLQSDAKKLKPQTSHAPLSPQNSYVRM